MLNANIINQRSDKMPASKNFDMICHVKEKEEGIIDFSILYYKKNQRMPLRILAREMISCMRQMLLSEPQGLEATRIDVCLFKDENVFNQQISVDPIKNWINQKNAGAYFLEKLTF